RARKLVLGHLERARHPNVFIVDSLEEMLGVSLSLFHALALFHQARGVAAGDIPAIEAGRVWPLHTALRRWAPRLPCLVERVGATRAYPGSRPQGRGRADLRAGRPFRRSPN